MAFQAQFWSPLFVVLNLFLFFSKQTTNARDLNSSVTNPVQGNHQTVNVLQKHVMFFDRNHDGVIYPSETFEGFRAIGCGIALSTTAAALINQGLSSKTRPGEPFDAKLPIVVKNIHMAKHTSDSGVYDKDGGFVASKFEEIFAKHAKANPNALTSNELNEFLKSNRQPNDQKGWMQGLVEWKILYKLGKDEKGLLQKETVRAAFDGSLFEQLAKKQATKTKKV